MSGTVLVFVHGINEKLPKREEMRRWRDALSAGNIDSDTLGLKTTFGYYADWFFKGSNEPKLDSKTGEVLSETAARIETKLSDGPSKLSPDAQEAMFGLDISTFVPQRMVRLFLEKSAGQLFQYFDNAKIAHPTKSNAKGGARDVIRDAVVNAITEARAIADKGEKEGKVIVVAHSMGSVVAWDVIAHDERCPEVNGLVTLGSPLALDFVLRGLKEANKKYSDLYPAKLSGDWYNFIAHHDLVGQFDVDFVSNFGKGSLGQKIYSREIDNPELMSGQGPWQRLQSAHTVTGYLRHAEVADALTKLSQRDIDSPIRVAHTEKSPRRGDRRAMMVSKGSFERFSDTEARRRQISAGQGGRLGLAQFETRERIVKKLSLMDVPKDLAKSLLDQASSGSEQGSVSLERILGSNDFITSSFALKAAALTSAVGKLEVNMSNVGTWSGTGFLISKNLLMTNNHVLATPEEAASATLLLDYSYSSEEEERNAIRYALRPDQFFITSDANDLDYTIVAVDVPDEGLRRPWFQLIGGSGKALLGDSVNIIQHPDGRRQEIVVRNSAVTFVDDAKDYVYYEADTEGGSSGSPVCNDQWQLAFLHHASVPERDAEGHVMRTDGERYRSGEPDSDIHWISNEGIRISRIVKDVRTKLLSTGQHEMFDACFDDPDLTQFIHIAPRTFQHGSHQMAPTEAAGNAGHGGLQPMPQQAADGSMSWLFELNFGPAGGIRAAPHGGPQFANAQHNTGAPTRTSRLSPPLMPKASAPQTYSPSGPKDVILRDAAERLIERAKIEDEYYDEAKDEASIDAYYLDTPTTGGEVMLFKEYRQLLRLTHSREFSYSKARLTVLYPYADRHEDESLKSVYSGETLDVKDVIASEIATILRSTSLPMLGQEMLIEGDWLDIILEAADSVSALEATDPFNCEHVVPQSWFNKRQPMKADLHHLFTCEPKCNSFRNKFAYAEFDTYEAGHIDPEEAALRKTCGYRDLLSGDTHFEPEKNKGAVARATLYFLLRYPGEIGDADGEYTEEDLATLVKWHEAEPPTVWEKHRNRAIFLNQGNRNPLIDIPDLGGRIGFHKGLGIAQGVA